jgi:hypothetical protein
VGRLDRSSLLLHAAALLAPLILFVATSRPDIGFWDTGEMQTVPWIAGIAHPTGFPGFVLGGYVFSHLVALGPVAWRLTCFSAVAMALACWALFAAARELGFARPTSLLAAGVFATTPLAWSRGTRTEVHALAVASIALALWIGFRFLRSRDARLLPLGAAAFSFSLAVHPVAVFFAPLFCIWACVGSPDLPSRRTILACIASLATTPLLYMFLPLRSLWLSRMRVDPTLSLGIPAGRPYWDYGHTVVPANFLRELSGSDFTVGGGLSGIFSPAAYAQIPEHFFTAASGSFGGYGWAMLILIGLGLHALVKRIGPTATLAFALCGGAAVPFALSYTSESDIDRYFLAAYWCIALLFAGGTETLFAYAAERFTRLRRFRLQVVLPMLLLMYVCVNNLSANATNMLLQHQDHEARSFINRVLAVTPPNAIIVSLWTYATPLAYAAYVEGTMKERIVDTAWPAEDARYFTAWQSLRRPIVIVSTDGSAPSNVAAFRALDSGYPQLLLIERLK